MKKKHKEKKKIRSELEEHSVKLKDNVGMISFYEWKYRIKNVVKIKKQRWESNHKKKLITKKISMKNQEHAQHSFQEMK